MFIAENDRVSGCTEWIDLPLVERGQTELAIQVGIPFHLSGLSLSNTKQYLERLDVHLSRTAIHHWVQKTDLQPDDDVAPTQISVDETVIRIKG